MTVPKPAAPSAPPAPTGPFQTPAGDLTDAGVAFVRSRFRTVTKLDRTRVTTDSLTDAEIMAQFRYQPNWLEEIVKAERQAGWQGRTTTIDFLMTAARQTLRNLATRLQTAVRRGRTGHTVDDAVLGEDVAAFVQRLVDANDPVLRPAYDRCELSTDPSIQRRWEEFKWSAKQGKMSGFFLGKVGSKQPDIVEVRLSANEIEIIDPTFAVGDPIHNFKSAFYRAVVERLIDVATVTATDFRAPGRTTKIGP